MKRTPSLLLCSLPLAALAGLSASARPQQKPTPAPDPFARDAMPLVKKYCVACHAGPQGAGGIVLDREKTLAAALKNRATWDHAVSAIGQKRMPPADMPQPTSAEREKMVAVLESAFSQADCQIQDPGRVTMRRLNRAEYNNTIRDLLGVYVRPADDFPNDDVGYGFDNIGDVLSISPLLMEKYLTAAEKVAEQAVVPPGAPQAVRVSARELKGTSDGAGNGGGYQLGRTGDATFATFDVPSAGAYAVRIEAYGDQAPPEPVKMGVLVDGVQVQSVDIFSEAGKPLLTTLQVKIDAAGQHKIGARFLNNNDPRTRKKDRNLYINFVELQLPDGASRGLKYNLPENGSEAAWDAAARATLGKLATRAYRRPVTPAELNKLVSLAKLARETGAPGEYAEGLQLAVRAVLSSPSFLFRPEPDARPDDPTAKRPLNDYELATRLSYFLWSSMPDDTLLALAAQGKLKDPQVLVQQAKRMLKDPKSSALADNFAGQWLQLRKLAIVQPDDKTFTEALRQAMAAEPARFFTGVVQEDRSVLEFLDADYTYVNEALAKHYGIPGVTGEKLQKVALPKSRGGGLLGMAGVLTLTSNPNRTSPVKRGKWVLDNILGTPPPPPPPNVPELDKPGGPLVAETLRKRLELHRTNPACANCHAQMDPIGLALENYDLLGRWRDTDAGKPIETAGTLPDGSKFDGPQGLKAVLLKKKATFARALTERTLTYALGRGVERTDRCNLDAMAASVAKNDYKFSALVEAVVVSPPFRERRGDESGRKTATK